jgi:hypothetical protein
MGGSTGAGWSSLAARRAHNPKVVGSNPTPATKCPYCGDDERTDVLIPVGHQAAVCQRL